jgi:hypothetical protein
MFAFQIKTVIAYNHIKRLKKEITHFFTNILELEPITSKYWEKIQIKIKNIACLNVKKSMKNIGVA